LYLFYMNPFITVMPKNIRCLIVELTSRNLTTRVALKNTTHCFLYFSAYVLCNLFKELLLVRCLACALFRLASAKVRQVFEPSKHFLNFFAINFYQNFHSY